MIGVRVEVDGVTVVVGNSRLLPTGARAPTPQGEPRRRCWLLASCDGTEKLLAHLCFRCEAAQPTMWVKAQRSGRT
jgi:hypothetical protein